MFEFKKRITEKAGVQRKAFVFKTAGLHCSLILRAANSQTSRMEKEMLSRRRIVYNATQRINQKCAI